MGRLCTPGLMIGQNAAKNYTEFKGDTVFNKMIPLSVALPQDKLDEIIKNNKCTENTYF